MYILLPGTRYQVLDYKAVLAVSPERTAKVGVRVGKFFVEVPGI